MTNNIGGQHLGPGSTVSRYEIKEVLGAGGFGITYKVFDTSLHCEAAMKEYLPAELAVRGGDGTTVLPRSESVAWELQHGLTRFLDEARTLAKFKNRHIVRVSDYMEANGTAYLVMDYEEGQSLRALLRQRGGSLSETEIRNIFIPILDGLKVVHEAGLLHRDIKPDNIYLRKEGPPVLLDFGAARQYTASQTRSVTATVTPGYAPFEQYQSEGHLGAWTDLYGLGATLYACVSGKPPVDAITRHAQPRADPMPLAQEVGVDRYSEGLLRTIDWMLRPSIGDRPQSVDEVLPCLQGRAEPPPDVVPAPAGVAATVRLDTGGDTGEAHTMVRGARAPAVASPASSRRTGLIAGLAVIGVVIAAGAGWWYVQDRRAERLAGPPQRAESTAQTASRQEEEAPAAAPEPAEPAQAPAAGSISEQAAYPDPEPEDRQPSESGPAAAQDASSQPAVSESAAGEPERPGEAPASAETVASEPDTAAPDAREEAPAAGETTDPNPAAAEPAAPAPEETRPTTQTTASAAAAAESGTASGPDSEAGSDKVTENVDEFLTALMLESSQSEGGGQAEPARAGSLQASSGRVATLLERAEAYRSASRLVAPEGDNAWALYRQVLAIDADNAAAKAGMQRIGDVFEQAAATMVAENRPDVGLGIVERGLTAVPDHPGLQRLRSRLASR